MHRRKIKFALTRNVKQPKREEGSAGIDFFVPFFSKDFYKSLYEYNPDLNMFKWDVDLFKSELSDKNNDDVEFDSAKEKYIYLCESEDIVIPSGIICQMEKSDDPNMDVALIAHNKSGIATKLKLVKGAQVVDYSYRGEILMHLLNESGDMVKIEYGQKILQFVETPIFTSKIDIVKVSDINLNTNRGAGWAGSTGIK